MASSQTQENQKRSETQKLKSQNGKTPQQKQKPIKEVDAVKAAIRAIAKAASEVLCILKLAVHTKAFGCLISLFTYAVHVFAVQQFVEQEVSCSDQQEGIDVVIR